MREHYKRRYNVEQKNQSHDSIPIKTRWLVEYCILMMKLLKVSFSQHMNQTFESCSLQLVRTEMNLTDLHDKRYNKG